MKNNGTNKNTERLHSLSVPWMREERIQAYQHTLNTPESHILSDHTENESVSSNLL